MQLQSIETISSAESTLTSTQSLSQTDMWAIILVIAIVLFLAVGLIKKTLWMCITAIILSIILGISHPTQLEEVKDAIVSFFDRGIEPLKDDDYSDMTESGDLTPTNSEFEDKYNSSRR